MPARYGARCDHMIDPPLYELEVPPRKKHGEDFETRRPCVQGADGPFVSAGMSFVPAFAV